MLAAGAPLRSYQSHQPTLDAAWIILEERLSSLHRGYFSSRLAPPLVFLPLGLRERFRREQPASAPSDEVTVRLVAAAPTLRTPARTSSDMRARWPSPVCRRSPCASSPAVLSQRERERAIPYIEMGWARSQSWARRIRSAAVGRFMSSSSFR